MWRYGRIARGYHRKSQFEARSRNCDRAARRPRAADFSPVLSPRVRLIAPSCLPKSRQPGPDEGGHPHDQGKHRCAVVGLAELAAELRGREAFPSTCRRDPRLSAIVYLARAAEIPAHLPRDAGGDASSVLSAHSRRSRRGHHRRLSRLCPAAFLAARRDGLRGLIYGLSYVPVVRTICRITDRYLESEADSMIRLPFLGTVRAREGTIGTVFVAILIAINLAQVALSVRLNFFSRDMFNALQDKDAGRLLVSALHHLHAARRGLRRDRADRGPSAERAPDPLARLPQQVLCRRVARGRRPLPDAALGGRPTTRTSASPRTSASSSRAPIRSRSGS